MGLNQYNAADFIGKHFGILTVVGAEFVSTTSSHRAILKLVCDHCGRVIVRPYAQVKYFPGQSCACRLGSGMRRHGKYVSVEYRTWGNIKSRCRNPASGSYPYYGGRGISVCERWLGSFEAFLEDMGPRPEGYSIERIDVNGNYCPENCKWIPRWEQYKNIRKNRRIEFRGEIHTGREIARIFGVSSTTITDHFNRGNFDSWLAKKSAQLAHSPAGA